MITKSITVMFHIYHDLNLLSNFIRCIKIYYTKRIIPNDVIVLNTLYSDKPMKAPKSHHVTTKIIYDVSLSLNSMVIIHDK